MSIHRYGCECKDTHVDAQHLDERTEGAHEVRQVPALQQRRLELWGEKKNITFPPEDPRQTFVESNNPLNKNRTCSALT